MTLIEWNDGLSVHVELIDNQHKKLIDMLNSLEGFTDDEKGQKRMGEVLIGLAEYTQYHFSDEEKLMRKINYPDYDNHKRQHKNLIKQVSAILIRLKKGKEIHIDELTKFLTDWLTDHIKAEDTRIGKAIAHLVKVAALKN